MDITTPNKTHTIPSSTPPRTYAYIHHPPATENMPTLLFIHGFPATSYEWAPQIEYFGRVGYGVLALDCLGYGGTSKPLDVKYYVGKSMAEDLMAILDKEEIGRVVGIAHDWGTYLLSQLVGWFEERLEAIMFFSVPFSPLGRELDVRKINEVTKKKVGYEQYGYQIFLASEDAGKIIGEHWESFFHLTFCADPSLWATSFAPANSLRDHLLSNTLAPLAPYLSSSAKPHHHAVFGDDYTAPCLWYVRGLANLGVDEELRALKAGEINQKLRLPTLMVTGLRDKVCPAKRARVSMNGTVEGGEAGRWLKVVDVDAGHWIMLEKAEETNRVLGEWLGGLRGEGQAPKSLL